MIDPNRSLKGRVVAAAALLAVVTAAQAQTINRWVNLDGGLWNVASNWSLNEIPQAGHSVYIDLDGTLPEPEYQVTLNKGATIANLNLDTADATLVLDASWNLTVTGNTLLNAGNFEMESNNYYGDTLTNNTNMELHGTSRFLLDTSFVQNGTFILRTTAAHPTAGVELYVDVTNTGTFKVVCDHVDAYIDMYRTSPGPATLFEFRNAPGGELICEGSGSTRIDIEANVVNEGTTNIRFETDFISASLPLLWRNLSGSLFTVENGVQFKVPMGEQFAHEGGSIDVLSGLFLVDSGGSLSLTGGDTTGTITCSGATVELGAVSAEIIAVRGCDITIPAGAGPTSAEVVIGGSNNTLTGDIPSGVTVKLEPNGAEDVKLDLQAPLQNSGVIVMNSAAAYTTYIEGGPLTNLSDGMLIVASEASGTNHIKSSLDNQGTMVVNADLDFGVFGGAHVTNSGIIIINNGSTLSTDVSVTIQANGTINLLNGSSLSAGTSVTTEANGTINLLNGSSLSAGTSVTTEANGILAGEGTIQTITGFVNQGILRPEPSPAILAVIGDFTQAAPGSLEIGIGGLIQGECDQVNISGVAALGGELALHILAPFVPDFGNTFNDVVTFNDRNNTEFSTYSGTNLGGERRKVFGPIYDVLDMDIGVVLDCDEDPQAPGYGFGDPIEFIDADSDLVPDLCDNCDYVANWDQLDSDGDGIGDVCDDNSIQNPLFLLDKSGTILETFIYDSERAGKLVQSFKGTPADHLISTTYEYDADGKLTRVIHTPTDGTPSRTIDKNYDVNDVYIGDTSTGCGCGNSGTFVYRDDLMRVTQITTADPVSPAVLETFSYEPGGYRLTEHSKLTSAGTVEVVASYAYTDYPSGAYDVIISMPVSSAEFRARQETYDEKGWLTSVGHYEDLIPTGGGVGPPTYVTQYVRTEPTVDPNGNVIHERWDVIQPSGATQVREMEITGTAYSSGSARKIRSWVTYSGGGNLDLREATYAYIPILGDYRLSQVDEPTGARRLHFYTDGLHPFGVTVSVRSAPGGIGQFSGNVAITTYEYDAAGRVELAKLPHPTSPASTVDTSYQYDTYGRMTSLTDDVNGLARISNYRYDAFDAQIVSQTPDGLVRVNEYDDVGRLTGSFSCDYPGDLSQFDPLNPGMVLDYSVNTYHIDSNQIETISVALSEYLPFVKETPSGGFAVTKNDLDATGTWINGISLPYPEGSPPDAWTTTTYDYQGQATETTSPEGVVSKKIYDGRGLVAQSIITDNVDEQLVTTFEYNGDGQLEFTSLPDGTYRRNEYDAYGRLFQEKRCDAQNCDGTYSIVTNYVLDDAGLVLRRHAAGVTDVVTDYDTWGRPYRVRQRAVYDLDDDIDADGLADIVTLTEYNLAGSLHRQAVKGSAALTLTTIELGLDRVTENAYNNLGQTTSVIQHNIGDSGQFQEETSYVYDYPNRAYDAIVDPVGLAITTTFKQDAAGRNIQVIDPEGHYSNGALDSLGRLIMRTGYEEIIQGQRDGQGGIPRSQARWTYNVRGLLAATAGMASAGTAQPVPAERATDQVTDYEYDDDGRQLLVKTYNMGDGTAELITEFQYDDIGRPKKVFHPATDPGQPTEKAYVESFYESGTGRLDRREMLGVFDALNRTVYVMDYAYDGLSRPDTMTRHEQGGTSLLVTSYGYDDADRIDSVTNEDNVQTGYAFDLLGRTLSMTEAVGKPTERTTTHEFIRLGWLSALTAYDDDNAENQRTEYAYDLVGRRTQILLPDAETIDFRYDLAGRLDHRIDQRGIRVDYTYHPRGLLWTRHDQCPPGVDCDNLITDDYQYDGLGRLTYARRRVGATLDEVSETFRVYNDLSDMTYEFQELLGNGELQFFGYTYDQAGNRRTMNAPPAVGVTLGYDYDALNRATAIKRDGNELVQYVYDGLLMDQRRVRTTAAKYIEYDPGINEHRRPEEIENRLAGSPGTTLAKFTYAFTGVGNLDTALGTGNTVHAGNLDYDHDDLNRLKSATYTNSLSNGVETVNTDLLNNRTSYTDTRDGDAITYALNNVVNEYTQIGAQTVQYDDAGNLTTDEDEYRYEYDFENRLVRITHVPGLGGGLTSAAEFTYDALGRRIRATYYETAGTESSDVLYYYDGPRVFAEYDANVSPATPLRYFVDGALYVDEHVLLHDEATGDDHYYLSKDLFTVAGLADEYGNLTELYGYDAYGAVQMYDGSAVPIATSAAENPYFFTGRRLDRVSNLSLPRTHRQLYHYRARESDPLHGRFLQRDPAEYVDGMNAYEYVQSRPAQGLDPSGKIIILVHGVNAAGSNSRFRDPSAAGGVRVEPGWYSRARKGLNAGPEFCKQAIIGFKWGDKNFAMAKPSGINPESWFTSSEKVDKKVNGRLWKLGGRVGYATDNIKQMSDTKRRYMARAVSRLYGILYTLNEWKTTHGSSEPINIIAHSQGTIITLAALARGAKANAAILMGSPWDPYGWTGVNEEREKNWATAVNNLDKLYTYWSTGDEAVAPKGGIGGNDGEDWAERMEKLSKSSERSWAEKVASRQFGPGIVQEGYKLPRINSGLSYFEYNHSDYMARAKFFTNIHLKDIASATDFTLTKHAELPFLRYRAAGGW